MLQPLLKSLTLVVAGSLLLGGAPPSVGLVSGNRPRRSELRRSQSSLISLTPSIIQVGSPELLHLNLPGADRVQATWLGRQLDFFPAANGRDWFALAGVDVEDHPGPSLLTVTIHQSDGAQKQISQPVLIHPAHYRTGILTVAPKFVEPGPPEQAEIAAATADKQRAFAQSAPQPLWSGDFIAPVPAAATDSFGTRRIFNGHLASIHKGTDFRAPLGTPVLAANSGRVVLAEKLYYEGNCVILDHGLDLWTLSMHLSRIEVHPGQMVAKGQRLGLSGATGRVTGPHLHWAVRWQGAMLDPARLLRLDLAPARP